MGDLYATMLAELFAARRLGVRPGVGRMREALVRLGRPERSVGCVVQIGGTNGKGSTASFLGAMLREGGWRTGLYTSPHLCRFTERIRLSDAEAAPERLARLYPPVGRVARDLELTFFEQATLLALCFFAEERPDVTLLEVGIGGRLDATSAVDADLSLVTGVELDHQDLLGADLDSIAREKAGIFRRDGIAIIGRSGSARGRVVLEEEARRTGASEVIVVPSGDEILSRCRLGLVGSHQQDNAAAALSAVAALERATGGRIVVPGDARRRGLEKARWPGRLEKIATAPQVWIDAAHNPDGARSLAREISAWGARVILVVGVCADKDVPGILEALAPLAATIVATRAPSPRALDAATLGTIAARSAGGSNVLVEHEPLRALALAREAAGKGGVVVVCGSIFLVGAIRAAVCGERVDPIMAQDPLPVRVA